MQHISVYVLIFWQVNDMSLQKSIQFGLICLVLLNPSIKKVHGKFVFLGRILSLMLNQNINIFFCFSFSGQNSDHLEKDSAAMLIGHKVLLLRKQKLKHKIKVKLYVFTKKKKKKEKIVRTVCLVEDFTV